MRPGPAATRGRRRSPPPTRRRRSACRPRAAPRGRARAARDRGGERVAQRARGVAELVARLTRREPPVLPHQVRRLGRKGARQADRLSDPRQSLDAHRQHHDRVAHAGQLRDAIDELGPTDVDAAENVTLAGFAVVGGEELAGGDVLDVDEVHRRVQHPGQAAAEVVADRPRRGLARLRTVDRYAEHVRRVDDDELDAMALGRFERGALARVLGVRIRQAEPVSGVARGLIRRPIPVGRPDRRDRRGEHHAANALGRCRLDRDHGSLGVQLPYPLHGTRRDVSGDVEEHVRTTQRPPHRPVVEYIALRPPVADAGERLQAIGVSVDNAHVVAAFRQRPHDVGSDETGSSGHAGLHGVSLLGRLNTDE